MASHSGIHVLGLGSIGIFAAHAIANYGKSLPVTLLLHRRTLLDDFNRKGGKCSLEELNGNRIDLANYGVEVQLEDGWHKTTKHGSKYDIQQPACTTSEIQHLIVTVKAPQTITALRPLRNRLSRHSTILFLQNGCGQIDAVREQLFPIASERPNFLIGVISHGVSTLSPFQVRHTGPSATSLGPVPRGDASHGKQDKGEEAEAASYLLELLPQCPRLAAKSYAYEEVLQFQLEKLAVNAFNAVAALADSDNSLYFSGGADRISSLVREVSEVVLALPELRGSKVAEERFAYERFRATVERILWENKETTNSMVWDLRRGLKTEVEFINGYWVKRGREVGVETPINQKLVDDIRQRERYGSIPATEKQV